MRKFFLYIPPYWYAYLLSIVVSETVKVLFTIQANILSQWKLGLISHTDSSCFPSLDCLSAFWRETNQMETAVHEMDLLDRHDISIIVTFATRKVTRSLIYLLRLRDGSEDVGGFRRLAWDTWRGTSSSSSSASKSKWSIVDSASGDDRGWLSSSELEGGCKEVAAGGCDGNKEVLSTTGCLFGGDREGRDGFLLKPSLQKTTFRTRMAKRTTYRTWFPEVIVLETGSGRLTATSQRHPRSSAPLLSFWVKESTWKLFFVYLALKSTTSSRFAVTES